MAVPATGMGQLVVVIEVAADVDIGGRPDDAQGRGGLAGARVWRLTLFTPLTLFTL